MRAKRAQEDGGGEPKIRETGESRKKYKDQNTADLEKRGVEETTGGRGMEVEGEARDKRQEICGPLQGWLIGQSGRPEFLAIRIPSIYQHSLCNYHDQVEPSEQVLELYLEIAKSNHNRRTDMEPPTAGVHYPAPMGTRRYLPSQCISLSGSSITGHEPSEAQVPFPPPTLSPASRHHRRERSEDFVHYYLFCFVSVFSLHG